MKGPFLKASQARLTWAMHRAEYKFQECLMPILQWLSRDKDLRTAASVPFCLVEEVERHMATAVPRTCSFRGTICMP